MSVAMYTLFGVVIGEGLGFIFALMRVSYKAGAVLQWMKDTDRRLERLEEDSHKHNPNSGIIQGGDTTDNAHKT